MNYTQAQIDRANAVSLEDFLRTQGETLIKSGREYRWKEHDSLTVRGNKWFRHSQSKGGYPIDFVMEFYGKSFPEAVQLLTGESAEGQSEAATAPPTAFHLPLHNRTADRAIQYNLSYQANSACKEAIEQTISAHYAENRLDTEAAVKDVLEKFGTERVQFILANTIQRKNYDGRISQDNKAWAKTIPMLEDSGASRHSDYLVVDQVNPGLTDLFTRQFRKVAQEQQKSSVLQKLKQEPPARKPAAPKKREPER